MNTQIEVTILLKTWKAFKALVQTFEACSKLPVAMSGNRIKIGNATIIRTSNTLRLTNIEALTLMRILGAYQSKIVNENINPMEIDNLNSVAEIATAIGYTGRLDEA